MFPLDSYADLGQTKCADLEDLLKETSMLGCEPSNTLIESNHKYLRENNEEPMAD